MSLAADGLTPARCARRAAALLESAENHRDDRALTMSASAAMVPLPSMPQGEGGSNP